MLEKAGATVVMTRTDDTSVGILARGKFNKAQNTTCLFRSTTTPTRRAMIR
jgi:N-acetylmuramoyl-L-alanine amidase